ncbi:cGMP-dependent 3',5'-cyclic phosphodiesterase-like isoform X2 [Osmerus mordax]|uniref:cGMP-dependent 3',5'-cyclic phosphodiesterase-like isoform X2 n=1 Tax=Osmerus mordax TaxID=8014 RepID=UPI00350F89BB
MLQQVLTALFRFFRGGRQVLPPLEEEGVHSDALQDALLRLASVADSASLRDAIRESLLGVLSRPGHVYVYLAEAESGCFWCENPPHELQKEGRFRDVVVQQRRVQYEGFLPSELQDMQGQNLSPPLQEDKPVLLIPIPDQDLDETFALLVLCCTRPTEGQEQNLDILEKHVTVACRRVRALQGQTGPQRSEVIRSSNVSETVAPEDVDRNAIDQQILRLCGDLYDLDATTLQLKVLHYLEQRTQSLCCCLLLVSEDSQQLFCQVVGDKVLDREISFPLTFGRLGRAVDERTSVSLQDVTPAEHQQLNGTLGFEVRSMLCVPVECRATSKVVALACAFNKKGAAQHTEADERIVQHCFRYTSSVLTSTLAFQKERRLKFECQALLQVAKNLFTHLDDVSVLLKEIIAEARRLTSAEICSVFLLDRFSQELVAKVFDGGVVIDEETELRIPADQGIAGHVATTGQILNITDAYSHPLFYRAVDASTGFRTRNILCFPIKDEHGVVIGVAELVNKTNGPWFTRLDEDLATAFSIYCGISIAHSLLYKKVDEAQFRSQLANEMMKYHMKVSEEEVTRLLVLGLQPVADIHPCFSQFTYTPRSLPDDSTPLAIMSMFEDMGFINTFKINMRTLARFCLMVKRGYRDPPYHNWMHAFSVSHFCYLLCKNLELSNYLEGIEIFALFVSCMCHDLDHRGTNNSFQVASKSVLAGLYSSEGSVLERHHFAQAIAILNTQGCNIFEKFSRKDYQRMLDLMSDIILATDLAHHLRILNDLKKMADKGYDISDPQHHNLLLCMMMTSCDLSDQTKDWKTTWKIAGLIYKEFFSQGDLEKAMGNLPIEMMDREKAYIPQLQIGFMEHIAMPIYKLLQDMFPKSAELYETVASNREQWAKVSHKLNIRGLPANDFLDEEFEQDASNGQDEQEEQGGSSA